MRGLRRDAALVWLSGCCTLAVLGATHAGPPVSFQELDRDADGFVSAEECRRLPELHARFSELDKDGNGLLDREEFARFWKRRAPPPEETMPSFLDPARVHTKAI